MENIKESQVEEVAKYAAQRNVENVVDEDVAKDLGGESLLRWKN